MSPLALNNVLDHPHSSPLKRSRRRYPAACDDARSDVGASFRDDGCRVLGSVAKRSPQIELVDHGKRAPDVAAWLAVLRVCANWLRGLAAAWAH